MIQIPYYKRIAFRGKTQLPESSPPKKKQKTLS